ncbi:EAL domain-containing response regulator [Sulfurimonas gotlandica]|nr:EAL domain-containing protein [Sulfurimonas gotlandica]EDZ61262.1 diguanylate cyclase/phosphodiesterase [Sulfurimonas gotlandica GD1]
MESKMVDLKKLKDYTKDMRVLYVEDDLTVQTEMSEFLKRFFPTVVLANNGKEGLEAYKEGNYDLIISDINMPVMNGIEMSKTILGEDQNQSIVIISAYNDSEYLLDLINLGIEYFVLKPVGLKQLTKIIYRVAQAHNNKKLAHLYHESIKKQNIELEKSLEEKSQIINTQIYRDSLTGLDNLCAFMYNTNNHKHLEFTVLMLLDVDNLQHINDLYGTKTGNQVLISFSKLIKEFSEEYYYELYHTSGDQFVLLDQVAYIDTEKYEIEFDILLNRIKEFTFFIDDFKKEISVNATIGMSLGLEHPLKHADMALKNAKDNNKTYAVYNTLIDTTKEMQEKMEWRHKITDALENNRIVPVYQPIVDRDANVIKYESLMRILEIVDNQEILISPDKFLKISLETKQYSLISAMMIYKVLDFLQTNEHTISINLTYSDITNKSFMESLYKRISKENLGNRLIVEITENESVQDYKLLKKSIERFRSLGVKIAIDDFGSGYSNFSQILEIHPEYIKIDGTLIENIDIDSHAFILTKAIVTFFNELGIKVIAEYVHSEKIHEILQEFNIDEFQGYYFSEPLREI